MRRTSHLLVQMAPFQDAVRLEQCHMRERDRGKSRVVRVTEATRLLKRIEPNGPQPREVLEVRLCLCQPPLLPITRRVLRNVQMAHVGPYIHGVVPGVTGQPQAAQHPGGEYRDQAPKDDVGGKIRDEWSMRHGENGGRERSGQRGARGHGRGGGSFQNHALALPRLTRSQVYSIESMSARSLPADAVRTADWQPKKGYNQLAEYGRPLICLPGDWRFDHSMREPLHEMILLLNAAEPSVFFDWGGGFYVDGSPYFIYYLGDYTLAKRAVENKLTELNEIWKPAYRALHFGHDPKGKLWIYDGNDRAIELSDLDKANTYAQRLAKRGERVQ